MGCNSWYQMKTGLSSTSSNWSKEMTVTSPIAMCHSLRPAFTELSFLDIDLSSARGVHI